MEGVLGKDTWIGNTNLKILDGFSSLSITEVLSLIDLWIRMVLCDYTMASSGSAKKRKSKVVFDNSKFVSEEAQDRYYESVCGRTLIAERGLTITLAGYPSIASVIRERK